MKFYKLLQIKPIKTGMIPLILFSAFFPYKFSPPSIYIHILLFIAVLYFTLKKTNITFFVFIMSSLIIYFFPHSRTHIVPLPVWAFLFYFISLNEKIKEDIYEKEFLIGSALFIAICIGEYFYIFYYKYFLSNTHSIDLYKAKLLSTYDKNFASRVYGNIHNIIPFIIGILCWTAAKIATLNHKKDKKLYAIVFFTSFLFLSLVIARGAFLYFAFYIIFISIAYKRYKILSIFSIFSIAFFFLNPSVLLYFYNSIVGIFNSTDTSVSSRFLAIQRGIKLLQENFLFGVGTGNYPMYDPIFTSPHNFFLHISVENGILGVFFFLFISYTSLKCWENIYCKTMFFFILYMSLFGALLIDGRIDLNYIFLTFLFLKIIYMNEKNSKTTQELNFRKLINEKYLALKLLTRSRKIS